MSDSDLTLVCSECRATYWPDSTESGDDAALCEECASVDIPTSACCGAEMPDWPDCDLCPRCKEHSSPFEEYYPGLTGELVNPIKKPKPDNDEIYKQGVAWLDTL